MTVFLDWESKRNVRASKQQDAESFGAVSGAGAGSGAGQEGFRPDPPKNSASQV